MYITPSTSQHIQTAADPAGRQRRIQSRANSGNAARQTGQSRSDVKARDTSKDEKAAANLPVVSAGNVSPAGKATVDTVGHNKRITTSQYYQGAGLLDVRSAVSSGLYTSAGYSDQSGVRGNIASEGYAIRRGQEAVASYSENQMLEERSHFTRVLGIDDYA